MSRHRDIRGIDLDGRSSLSWRRWLSLKGRSRADALRAAKGHEDYVSDGLEEALSPEDEGNHPPMTSAIPRAHAKRVYQCKCPSP